MTPLVALRAGEARPPCLPVAVAMLSVDESPSSSSSSPPAAGPPPHVDARTRGGRMSHRRVATRLLHASCPHKMPTNEPHNTSWRGRGGRGAREEAARRCLIRLLGSGGSFRSCLGLTTQKAACTTTRPGFTPSTYHHVMVSVADAGESHPGGQRQGCARCKRAEGVKDPTRHPQRVAQE